MSGLSRHDVYEIIDVPIFDAKIRGGCSEVVGDKKSLVGPEHVSLGVGRTPSQTGTS
jgi:hypothetical protein